MKRTLAILLAAIMVLGTLPALALGSSAAADVYDYIATDPNGQDVTGYMSDGDIDDYIDRNQWYDYVENAGVTWTVENGRLYIAGVGDITTDTESAKSYPWYSLRNEITEVVIFPNSITNIGANAFASLSKLTRVEIGAGVKSIGDTAFACGANGLTVSVPTSVTSVGNAVLEGCSDVTIVLNGATFNSFLYSTSIGNDNGALESATFVENTTTKLTIAPVGLGFANSEDGVTELSFTLKNGSTPFAVPEGYSWKVLVTDGTRWSREAAGDASSAMKLIAVNPSSADTSTGTYTYDVCELEGENQFIPQYECSYVITVQIFDKDGKLAYTATSDYHEFKMDVWAIYEERTSAVVLNGWNQGLDIDLGKPKPVGKVEVACLQSSTRIYNWVAYGTNDPTLPLSKWTFLGEKQGTEPSQGYFAAEVDPVETIRYIRVIGTYNSSNWGFHFAEIAVYGPPASYIDAPFTATDFYGDDWTAEMTDGSYDDYTGAYGQHTWYDLPDGDSTDLYPAYVWTIEQGRLIIGGIDEIITEEKTPESYPWYKFRDEITEIIIFPGTVSGIGENAFASLSKVNYIEVGAGVTTIGSNAFASGAKDVTISVPNTITSIGSGVLDGCSDVTLVLNNATVSNFLTYVSIGSGNEELDTATFVENTTTKLSIAPLDDGFDNRNGVTELSFYLTNANGTPFTVPEGYTWKLAIYDGKRADEPAGWIASAIKYISVDPSSMDTTNGLYRYEVCNLEGDNQFIPQYNSSYIIAVQIYDEDGNMAYQTTSAAKLFNMFVDPIYTERTAALAPQSRHGYLLFDLGTALPVGKIDLAFYQSSSRYYQWIAYGSNDPDLPLSQWTFLCEKMDKTKSVGSYTVDVDPGEEGYESFRYVRVYCTFNSERWAAHFAEAKIYAISSLCNVTWVIDGVSTTVPTIKGTFPTPEEPIKDPVYGDGYEINYVFLGWSDGTNLYKPGVDLPIITGDITYTAVFEELKESLSKEGDFNQDGQVTIGDVTLLLDMLAGKAELVTGSDLNGDGTLTIGDVTTLLDMISGNV